MTTKADELAARIVLDEGGYPTDDALDAISQWRSGEFRTLMIAIRRVWYMASWGWEEDDRGNGGCIYKISTAGWSGNESIIRALERNVLFWACCWVSSHRGGKHVFETLRK